MIELTILSLVYFMILCVITVWALDEKDLEWYQLTRTSKIKLAVLAGPVGWLGYFIIVVLDSCEIIKEDTDDVKGAHSKD